MTHSRPLLVVGGSIHYDVILQLPRLPEDNDRLLPTAFTLAPGGMGGNVASAAARLGAEVRFVGQFAADEDGIALRADLERDGVDTRWAGTRPTEDGQAFRGLILVDAEGRRAILGGWPDASRMERAPGQAPGHTVPVDTGAWRTTLAPIALPAEVFAGENVAFACPFNLALRYLGSVPDGVPVHLDIETGHISGWSDDEIQAVLRRTTVLYGNQRTLAAFARRLDQPSVTALSRWATLRDRTTIVETAGDLGCQVHANGIRTVIPPFPADAVDSTGAGDCFAAACTVALREGLPIHEATRFANAAAALSTRALGSRPGVPTRAELEAALARQEVDADAERSVATAPVHSHSHSRNPFFDLIVAPTFVTDTHPDDPNTDLLGRAILHR